MITRKASFRERREITGKIRMCDDVDSIDRDLWGQRMVDERYKAKQDRGGGRMEGIKSGVEVEGYES